MKRLVVGLGYATMGEVLGIGYTIDCVDDWLENSNSAILGDCYFSLCPVIGDIAIIYCLWMRNDWMEDRCLGCGGFFYVGDSC